MPRGGCGYDSDIYSIFEFHQSSPQVYAETYCLDTITKFSSKKVHMLHQRV